ncbi:MAG: macro domain-containing protein [Promethearchaeota archaeon]
MEYREIQQDLFAVGTEYHLAHCISSDCNMGAGIAVLFKNKFNIKAPLLQMDSKLRKHPTCIKIEGTCVFNLITKERYYQIPTYASIQESLIKMKNQAMKEGINKIAMPKIGSGLDKKKWEKVRETIKDVFKDTNIEILVCYL